jgi:potassium efflux system protein
MVVFRRIAAVGGLLIFLFVAQPLGAQQEESAAAGGGAAATLTRDTVKARLEEVEAATDLDESAKGSLIELYRKTLSSLERERAHAEASAAFDKARQTAPGEAQAVRDTLAKLERESPDVTISVSEDTPLAEVEQLLLSEKANQAAVDAKLSELEKQLALESKRPTAIRERITAARQSQAQLDKQARQAAPADELPLLTEARQWHLTAQARALSAELKMLDWKNWPASNGARKRNAQNWKPRPPRRKWPANTH